MPAGGPLRRTLSLGKAPTGRKLRDTTAGAITSTEKATTDADASAMFGVVVVVNVLQLTSRAAPLLRLKEWRRRKSGSGRQNPSWNHGVPHAPTTQGDAR